MVLAFPTQPKGLLVCTTNVLVHRAFAESASWDGVIEPLMAEGHRVVGARNPLRGLAADAASANDIVRTIEGPVPPTLEAAALRATA